MFSISKLTSHSITVMETSPLPSSLSNPRQLGAILIFCSVLDTHSWIILFTVIRVRREGVYGKHFPSLLSLFLLSLILFYLGSALLVILNQTCLCWSIETSSFLPSFKSLLTSLTKWKWSYLQSIKPTALHDQKKQTIFHSVKQQFIFSQITWHISSTVVLVNGA